MGNVSSDGEFLRANFITTIDRVQPSATVFQTKLGITIYETEHCNAPPGALRSRRRRPALGPPQAACSGSRAGGLGGSG